jgi:hypothetical protein
MFGAVVLIYKNSLQNFTKLHLLKLEDRCLILEIRALFKVGDFFSSKKTAVESFKILTLICENKRH